MKNFNFRNVLRIHPQRTSCRLCGCRETTKAKNLSFGLRLQFKFRKNYFRTHRNYLRQYFNSFFALIIGTKEELLPRLEIELEAVYTRDKTFIERSPIKAYSSRPWSISLFVAFAASRKIIISESYVEPRESNPYQSEIKNLYASLKVSN